MSYWNVILSDISAQDNERHLNTILSTTESVLAESERTIKSNDNSVGLHPHSIYAEQRSHLSMEVIRTFKFINVYNFVMRDGALVYDLTITSYHILQRTLCMKWLYIYKCVSLAYTITEATTRAVTLAVYSASTAWKLHVSTTTSTIVTQLKRVPFPAVSATNYIFFASKQISTFNASIRGKCSFGYNSGWWNTSSAKYFCCSTSSTTY